MHSQVQGLKVGRFQHLPTQVGNPQRTQRDATARHVQRFETCERERGRATVMRVQLVSVKPGRLMIGLRARDAWWTDYWRAGRARVLDSDAWWADWLEGSNELLGGWGALSF